MLLKINFGFLMIGNKKFFIGCCFELMDYFIYWKNGFERNVFYDDVVLKFVLI